MGRRWVAIIGAMFVVLGMIVSSTAKAMNPFIGQPTKPSRRIHTDAITGGMTLAGIGAGILELTALAVTSELAPTRKRGKYVAILVFTIIPFCPSVLWAQLIASSSGWRYCGVLCGVWNAVGLVMTVIFYHPPPRVNSIGMTTMETIRQIDFVGGLLSVSGMVLFMAGEYLDSVLFVARS
jgi:hypothetical protein